MSRWDPDLPVMFTETGFSQVFNRGHWRGKVGAADGVQVKEKTPVVGETRQSPGAQGLCGETYERRQADMTYSSEWLLTPFLPSV